MIFVQIAIMVTDIVIMPVDLAASPSVTAPTHPTRGRIVILRRRSVGEALREAELRGAPEHELQLLEEAAVAASIAGVRARLREGGTVSTAKREQFERDCELMRRFPNDRRGINGEGWFHLSR